MKGTGRVLLILCLVAIMLPVYPAMGEAAEPPAEENIAEWTVMFYLCGSDLESKYGYASYTLEEIAECNTYDMLRYYASSGEAEAVEDSLGWVNVVIETGGSKKWHTQENMGMETDARKLQRWHYVPNGRDAVRAGSPYELDESLPLASMADPETLADYIRWTAEHYPAKKYALVIWGHGSGSMTGVLIDELFDGDSLYLDELHNALQDGGVMFEAVLFDACLMANLETACAIRDNARWMIASEETVAGKGTAMKHWIQQLYLSPGWDGERLGRWICDMTQGKYADEADEQEKAILTWSVIDLSQVGRLEKMVDEFFRKVGKDYAAYPRHILPFIKVMSQAFELGLGENYMYDLSGIFYDPDIAVFLDTDLYSDILDALTDTVVYSIRGGDRSGALGLSFCYATALTPEELDIYSRNCPSAHYLAFLDAIQPGWTAPAWVYEKAEQLPDIQDIETFQIRIEKTFSTIGIPGISILSGQENVRTVQADLYRLNENTGETVRLGGTIATMNWNDEMTDAVYAFEQFGMWPALEGVHCDSELVSVSSSGMAYMEETLYNIPIQIGTEIYILRYSITRGDEPEMIIHGLWEGYDADSETFDRNVRSLSEMAGLQFRMLYPIDGSGESGKTLYETSRWMTMYKALYIDEEPLPAGTYYLDYWVEDEFLRVLPIGRVMVNWDGKNLSVPGGQWHGEMALTVE